jgi:hypothetical protein
LRSVSGASALAAAMQMATSRAVVLAEDATATAEFYARPGTVDCQEIARPSKPLSRLTIAAWCRLE